MPIPNVIHFIFFGFTNFELYHYLAVATANAVHKPDKIYMYNEVEPQNNFWWELTKEIVEVVHMKSPDLVGYISPIL